MVRLLGLTMGSLIPFLWSVGSPEHGPSGPTAVPVEESWITPRSLLIVENCAGCQLLACGHKAPGDLHGDIANPHEFCLGNPDCLGHPDCSATFLPGYPGLNMLRFPQLVDQASRGDRLALLALIKEYPSMTAVNVERHSLQVRGCDRTSYVANIPLDEGAFDPIAYAGKD
jgi:hypothetical protein